MVLQRRNEVMLLRSRCVFIVVKKMIVTFFTFLHLNLMESIEQSEPPLLKFLDPTLQRRIELKKPVRITQEN